MPPRPSLKSKTTPASKEKPSGNSHLAENRYAFHQYEILERYEAGIVLTGAEVKSARNREINIKPAYASIEGGEVILKNCHISPYKSAADAHYQPERYRKLLLNRKEINFLDKQLSEHGLTLIPLNIHLKKGKIKVELGLCRGKQAHDKRQDLKKKDQNREIERYFRK